MNAGMVIITTEEYRSLIKDSIKLAEISTEEYKSLIQDSIKLAEIKDYVVNDKYVFVSEIEKKLGIVRQQGKEE